MIEGAQLYQGSPNHFVAETKAFCNQLEPLVSRLRQRSRIPGQARVCPVLPRDHDGVLSLHRLLFSSTPDTEVMDRLRGISPLLKYCPKHSRILKSGSEVIGTALILTPDQEATAFLFAVVVARHYRHTWANALLKFATFSDLASAGFRHVVFRADPESPDSVRHARKVGAVAI